MDQGQATVIAAVIAAVATVIAAIIRKPKENRGAVTPPENFSVSPKTSKGGKLRLVMLCAEIFIVAVAVMVIVRSQKKDPPATLSWTLDNGILTISGKGDMPDFSAPEFSTFPAFTVSSTEEWLQSQYRDQIHTVIIKPGITSIGTYAFYACTNLVSVTIPDSVTSIGDYAFETCMSLTDVTIPDSVTDIKIGAFWYCTSLKSASIPKKCNADSAFLVGTTVTRR